MAKVLANSHSGFAGMSIIEMLEQHLTECCVQYLVIRQAMQEYVPAGDPDLNRDVPNVKEARGRIRGLAISIAMMRHPLRRYEVPWWDYVKKLEKRHVQKAKQIQSGTATPDVEDTAGNAG
ncbi:MAG: hypothetical protein AB7V39_26175 [Nitrospiraceae bacterium]